MRLSDRLSQPLHDELNVVGLDFTPGLDLGLVSILWVTLEIFARELASMDEVAGEFVSDGRVAHEQALRLDGG